MTEKDSLTALDYLESQLELEREARELMPYEPNTCTYPKVLRQQVFACLTCQKANGGSNVGVCYLCLIQCHSTHDIVELFSKRNFVCDCGTTRMKNGSSCSLRAAQMGENTTKPKLRTGSDSIQESFLFPRLSMSLAEDIPSLENVYNQNYEGRFCECRMIYQAELETRVMHQCFFGEACGEDWFHQDCILGFELNSEGIEKEGKEKGGKKFEIKDFGVKEPEMKEPELKEPEPKEPEPKESKTNDSSKDTEIDLEVTVPYFPDFDGFSEFICWKCVSLYPAAFKQLATREEIVFASVPHFANLKSPEHWKSCQEALEALETGQKLKRQKLNLLDGSKPTPTQQDQVPYSIFLREDFREQLNKLVPSLDKSCPLFDLLQNYKFLYEEDPIYEPSKDESPPLEGGSLFDLGSSALLSVPVPHALEGLQAYDAMKEKLSSFFKEFVDNKKVVTEKEVKDFFGKMREEKNP